MGGTSQFIMETVRRADHDRHLSVLYAPQDKRDALFALYAFNAEIATVRDRIREALPGEVRLQWWRDTLGAPGGETETGQPIADALKAAISQYSLPLPAFDNYLEARIFDLYNDPMPSRTDLEGYCGETASALIQLAAMVLDPAEAPRFAELAGRAGCAQAIVGLLLLLPIHRARGQCYVPADILTAVGSSPQEFLSGDGGQGALHAIDAMIALAHEHLAAFESTAAALPAALRPAFLPLALTGTLLAKMSGNQRALMTGGIKLSLARRHWLLWRRAMHGW
jgi:phytoene synthase